MTSENANQNRSAGFTLLEAVLVFGISATVLFSLVGLILSSFGSIVTLRDRIIATQLGQEAIEIAYNLRDRAFLQTLNAGGPPTAFDFYLQNCEGQQCCVDYETVDNAKQCPTENQRQLFLDSNGLYVLPSKGKTQTRFYRWLTAAKEAIPGDSSGAQRLRIDAYVSWENNQIHLTEYFYDWLPTF